MKGFKSMKSGFYPEIFHYNVYNRDKFIAKIAATLENKTRILDVGAGPCKYKNYFSHCDYKSQDFALYDGEGHSYGNLDYISDILSIPVENGSFDCILCSEVFEHIPRPDLALKEFSRILNKNGIKPQRLASQNNRRRIIL